MSKYTPGPWAVGKWGRSQNAVFAAGNAIPVAIVRADGHASTKTWNSRLISAAPDLLEALQASRAQWIHSVNAEKCLAAIFKATGEQA